VAAGNLCSELLIKARLAHIEPRAKLPGKKLLRAAGCFMGLPNVKFVSWINDGSGVKSVVPTVVGGSKKVPLELAIVKEWGEK